MWTRTSLLPRQISFLFVGENLTHTVQKVITLKLLYIEPRARVFTNFWGSFDKHEPSD